MATDQNGVSDYSPATTLEVNPGKYILHTIYRLLFLKSGSDNIKVYYTFSSHNGIMLQVASYLASAHLFDDVWSTCTLMLSVGQKICSPQLLQLCMSHN